MKEKRLRIPALRGCALLLALAAFNVRLRAASYEIITEETSAPVCLAVLPDLHSCAYGKGQRTLLAAVAAEIPDAVLLTGDIVDDVLPAENAWTAISALAAEREGLHILLAHRPERIDDYLAHPFDLIVSGHATADNGGFPESPTDCWPPTRGCFRNTPGDDMTLTAPRSSSAGDWHGRVPRSPVSSTARSW